MHWQLAKMMFLSFRDKMNKKQVVMSIIPREELQLECRQTGRNVVQEVLDVGAEITDDRMDELFEPLVNTVEQRTYEAVQTELDELRGQLEDKKEEDARADLVSSRVSHITETKIIHSRSGVALDSESELDMYETHETRYTWNLPRHTTEDILVQETAPEADVYDLDDEDVMDYSTDDEHWDDYKSHVRITFSSKRLEDIYNFLERGRPIDEIVGYCLEHSISQHELVHYADQLQYSGMSVGSLRGIIAYHRLYKPCQIVMKGGARRGQICGRHVQRGGQCNYHRKKSQGL